MSDLDNEELIATRRLNGLEDNLYKSADEMFEELGYKEEVKYREKVYEKDDKIITFNLEKKNIICNNFYDGYESINMQELQAINKKVEELGWI